MHVNWLGYNWRPHDGYGRYSAYLVRALRRAGVKVTPHLIGAAEAAPWLLDEWGIDWSIPTISCLPPYYLRPLPKGSAPHWLLTMTEGSQCPDGWAKAIEEAGIEHLIVPCEHNAKAFANGGVRCPITVIHGGTEPDDFPILSSVPRRPYTFLTIADRGKRKGWFEVYNAFFLAFGTAKEMGPEQVRLIIKCKPKGNDLVDFIIEKVPWIDPRITFARERIDNIADFYATGDCFAIPSRSEGWGMPHREAAMSGLPVITQRYSGMDDGHTDKWAIVVEEGHMEPVEATEDKHLNGRWRRCDWDELAAKMRWCYEHRMEADTFGLCAAHWLRANQTWEHTAAALIALMQAEGVLVKSQQPRPAIVAGAATGSSQQPKEYA